MAGPSPEAVTMLREGVVLLGAGLGFVDGGLPGFFRADRQGVFCHGGTDDSDGGLRCTFADGRYFIYWRKER